MKSSFSSLCLAAIFIAGVLFSSVNANAATRDFLIHWTADCQTVAGDTLDENGDGICELLDWYRFYTEDGSFITAIPETGIREYTIRYNAPWGTACHYMTAVIADPFGGADLESVPSNIGACKDVVPGKPNPPVVTN